MSNNYKFLIGLGVVAAGVGIYMYVRKKDDSQSNIVGNNYYGQNKGKWRGRKNIHNS